MLEFSVRPASMNAGVARRTDMQCTAPGWLLFLPLLLGAFLMLGMARLCHAQTVASPGLAPVAQQLVTRSGVPVLLPGDMHLVDYQGKPIKYYAQIEDAGARGYSVRIQDQPDCDYMACLVGYLTATKSGVPPQGQQPVELARGVHGVYTPMQLKVAAEVAFWKDGVEYHFRVGTTNRQKDLLVKIANAALSSPAIAGRQPAAVAPVGVTLHNAALRTPATQLPHAATRPL